MIDALRLGVDFLKEQEINENEIEVFEEFIEVMLEGSENIVPLSVKQGRVMHLGELCKRS